MVPGLNVRFGKDTRFGPNFVGGVGGKGVIGQLNKRPVARTRPLYNKGVFVQSFLMRQNQDVRGANELVPFSTFI